MKITDEKLYELCKKYGTSALLWRQKFIGLLPEVNRRKLYEKKGFSSIFEFAAKLCGLSVEQVRLALNLEKRFEDMPTLKKMLEDGEVSINKLTRVASIATVENQEELAEKVKILPVSALNTLIKDEKFAKIENQNGLSEPLFEDQGLYVQTFKLAPDVTEQLNELHSKGIDVNEFLRKALKQREEEIEKKKEEIAQELEDTKERNDARESTKDKQAIDQTEGLNVKETYGEPKSKLPSRYIPAKVKKIIKEEFGTKCSIPNCHKPAEVLHHTQKFGLSHSHNPQFLAPLCKDHHTIAHSIDVKYHEIRSCA